MTKWIQVTGPSVTREIAVRCDTAGADSTKQSYARRMSWTIFAPGGPLHASVKPTENSDASLTFEDGKHKGRQLAAGTWQMSGSDGPVPEIPRGAPGTSSKKPERDDPAGGFGENNT